MDSAGVPLLVGPGDENQASTTTLRGSSVTLIVVFSTLVAVCGSAVTGLASGYSSPAESGIRKDLGLSVAAYSLFGSLLTVGGLVASLVNGKITDAIGRRYTMGLSIVFSIAGWLLIVFAQKAWCLDLGRLSIGLGIGIIVYVVPVYITEITPRTVRGTFTSINQFSLCCSFSLMYFLGTVVSWRVLALIGVVPCLLQIIGLFMIPESPRWLVSSGKFLLERLGEKCQEKVGHDEEFEATLQRLRGKDADILREMAEIREYTEVFKQESSRFFDMFQRRYARSLVIAVGLLLLQPLGGVTAIVFYASSIFESAGFSSNVGTISMAIIQIPMTGLSVILIDKAGRRPLLLVSSAGMCLSCIVIGVAFCFQSVTHLEAAIPVMVFIGIMAYIVFYSIGIAALPWVIVSEVLPINIKGMAGSLASLVSWASSWVVTYTFNFMFEWSAAGTFFFYAAMCGLTIMFEATIVPETKGRSLEELQASLANFLSKDGTIVD